MQEIMAVAAAQEIRDGEVCLIGTGLPMVAAYLAKYTHAPNAVLTFESGIIDATPAEMAVGVGDFKLLKGAAKASNLYYALSLLQRGRVDLGFLGAAEVDEYGNINSTVIGDYFHPKVRLPGSGGANDIASMARRVVIIVPHEKRKFPRRVQYLTTPGFLTGPGAREKANLPGEGPVRVITDLAVMGFDTNSRRMKLESLHPHVSLQQVLDNMGFEPVIEGDVPTTSWPTQTQLSILRERVDPQGMYLNK